MNKLKAFIYSALLNFELAMLLLTILVLPNISLSTKFALLLNAKPLEYLCLIPFGITVYLGKQLSEYLRIYEKEEKEIYSWKGYVQYQIAIYSGIVYSLIFTIFGVVAWVINKPINWKGSLLIGAVIGSIITLISMEVNRHQMRKIVIDTIQQQ